MLNTATEVRDKVWEINTAAELRDKIWEIISTTDWNKYKDKDSLLLAIEVKAELIRAYKKSVEIVDYLLINEEKNNE